MAIWGEDGPIHGHGCCSHGFIETMSTDAQSTKNAAKKLALARSGCLCLLHVIPLAALAWVHIRSIRTQAWQSRARCGWDWAISPRRPRQGESRASNGGTVWALSRHQFGAVYAIVCVWLRYVPGRDGGHSTTLPTSANGQGIRSQVDPG